MKSIFYLHMYYVCIYLCDRFTCTFRCTVSFPFLDSVFQWIVQHLKVGKAVDFMAKSAVKIIEARKMNPSQNAQVSLAFACLHVFTVHYDSDANDRLIRYLKHQCGPLRKHSNRSCFSWILLVCSVM